MVTLRRNIYETIIKKIGIKVDRIVNVLMNDTNSCYKRNE